MKHAVKMVSGAMIYVPSFIKIGSDVQKLIRARIHKHTYIHNGDRIKQLCFFFKIRKLGQQSYYLSKKCISAIISTFYYNERTLTDVVEVVTVFKGHLVNMPSHEPVEYNLHPYKNF
jgi:hypothetical protein